MINTDNFELVAVFLASAAADASARVVEDRGWLAVGEEGSLGFLGMVMLSGGTPPPPVSEAPTGDGSVPVGWEEGEKRVCREEGVLDDVLIGYDEGIRGCIDKACWGYVCACSMECW